MPYYSVRGQLTRRAALFLGGAAVGAYAGAKLSGDVPPVEGTRLIEPAGGENTLNDASLLNQTPINRHIVLRENPGEVLINSVRAEMEAARNEGRPFNIGSPKQLAEVLFDQLKLPVIKKTKTGRSTDVEVLEELSKMLVSKNVGVFRFNFPFMEGGKGRPDPPKRAMLTIKNAIETARHEACSRRD